MSQPKRIPLDVWVSRRYAEKPPAMKTLYRWIRDAKIRPRPQKEGRAYYVYEHAEYVSPTDTNYLEKVAALDEQTTQ